MPPHYNVTAKLKDGIVDLDQLTVRSTVHHSQRISCPALYEARDLDRLSVEMKMSLSTSFRVLDL